MTIKDHFIVEMKSHFFTTIIVTWDVDSIMEVILFHNQSHANQGFRLKAFLDQIFVIKTFNYSIIMIYDKINYQ